VNGAQSSALHATTGGLADKTDKRLWQACQQLESFFWNEVLTAMYETVPGDGELGDSFARDVYQDMLSQQYSLLLAQQESKNGLAGVLYRELSGQQIDGQSQAEKAGQPKSIEP
jgi:Rod binding domain-containing protein